MRKKWMFFGTAAALLAISAAAAVLLSKPWAAPGSSSVPEFVIPAGEETAPATAQAETAPAAEPRTNTQEAPDEPESLPENIMLTSNDPMHQICFEFGANLIFFSGTYSGTRVTDISVLRSKASSRGLAVQGDSMSGTINVSGLQPGYYIISVTLENEEVMNYTFQVTENGARPVPPADIPAEKNLAAAENPLELPAQGVLTHITASEDTSKAREILSQIKELSDGICAGIADDYSRARALAQWVSENMYYDHDSAENGVSEASISLESTLEVHRSVCFGWSNLYAALCEAQGIECFVASGSVVTNSRCFPQTVTADERSHSWNLVRLPDRDIWVDTVWDSTNSFADGLYTAGGTDMQYFDITNGVLAANHRVTRFEHRDYFGLYG